MESFWFCFFFYNLKNSPWLEVYFGLLFDHCFDLCLDAKSFVLIMKLDAHQNIWVTSCISLLFYLLPKQQETKKPSWTKFIWQSKSTSFLQTNVQVLKRNKYRDTLLGYLLVLLCIKRLELCASSYNCSQSNQSGQRNKYVLRKLRCCTMKFDQKPPTAAILPNGHS